jgi:hypothetical protein
MDAIDVIGGALLGTVGGATAVVTGLSGFLGRIWAERIIEAERAKFGKDLERLRGDLEANLRRLQGDIDRTIIVHRSHFETEFNALRDIWQKVARLRAVLPLLRPLNGSDAANAQEASNVFSNAVDELIGSVDSQSPFYSKEIYAALDALRVEAKIELTEAATENPQIAPDWWKRRREHRNEINSRVSEISDLIRERLERLTVISS